MERRLTYKQCQKALEDLGVNRKLAREYATAIGGGLLSIDSAMGKSGHIPTNEGVREMNEKRQLEAFVAGIIGTEPEHVTAAIEGRARARLFGFRK